MLYNVQQYCCSATGAILSPTIYIEWPKKKNDLILLILETYSNLKFCKKIGYELIFFGCGKFVFV